MARATVSELDQQFRVVGCDLPVALQAKSHVEDLWIFRYGHLAHIPVTVFAILSGRHMRTVIKLNEIGNHDHWHPLNRPPTRNRFTKGFKQFTGRGLFNLLMASPTFGL